MVKRVYKDSNGHKAYIKDIKPAEHYSNEEIEYFCSRYEPGTDEYDSIIEKLYFSEKSKGRGRDIKNRLKYSIVPARQDNRKREIPMGDLLFDF